MLPILATWLKLNKMYQVEEKNIVLHLNDADFRSALETVKRQLDERTNTRAIKLAVAFCAKYDIRNLEQKIIALETEVKAKNELIQILLKK